MLNIEIHGYNQLEANALRDKIFRLLEKEYCVRGMSIAIFSASVEDKNGHNQPFLRLVNLKGEYVSDVLEILKTLKIDIQHLELKAFISAVKAIVQ